MASKINKEASACQRGTGEKIGTVAMSLSCFFLGFFVAFYFGWKLSLILLGALPFIAAAGIGWGVAMQSGTLEQMKAYAQSAGYAEQALQSIRIVQTYGNEILEYNNYSKYLYRAKEKQRESAIGQALGYASLFGMFFGFYAYAFYFGGMLRWEEVREGPDNKLYTGGRVIGIMFCIVFGAMQVGAGGPAFQAIQQGRVAMCLALKVIDHKPVVDVNDDAGKQSVSNVQGSIQFDNVCFKYPTRPDM